MYYISISYINSYYYYFLLISLSLHSTRRKMNASCKFASFQPKFLFSLCCIEINV